MSILPPAVLSEIAGRAALADQSGQLPAENIALLQRAGYLRAFVPTEFGGLGHNIEDIVQAQIALAGACPSTALAINMHQIWMGVARHLHRSGLTAAAERIWRDAVAGEVYAFGISEPNNDLVLMRSICEARPADGGGYEFFGTKIFTSNSQHWTRLGTFATDDSGPEPLSIFAILERERGGFTIRPDWDALGMRGSDSCTTLLEGTPVAPAQIIEKVRPGEPGAVVFGIFVTFEILLAAVYTGVAKRALEVAVETVKDRKSVKNDALYAVDPDIRALLSRAAIALDGIYPQLTLAARDLDNGVKRGPIWFPQASALKVRATETALDVVNLAQRACGGRSYFAGHELSRLYRDVVAGIFQPSDQESTQAAWARMLLDS